MKEIQEETMNEIIEEYKNGATLQALAQNYPQYSRYVITENLVNKGLYKRKHHKLHTKEEIKELIADKPYKMIEETFANIKNGFIAITNDGYYVKINRDNIFGDRMPEVFHPSNSYTIQNIKHYIESNNIGTCLLSLNYENNRQKLQWKCSCGQIFYRSWSYFCKGSTKCPKCSATENGLKKRISKSKVIETIENMGYHLEENFVDTPVTESRLSLRDPEGYLYDATWVDLNAGKTPERYHPSNKYTIQNINHYLELHRNGEYKCVSHEYVSNTSQLEFCHVLCGTIFEATWAQISGKMQKNKKDKYHKKCPSCNKQKTESIHASVLKQIFINVHPDTILEDKTCINPKTNRVLPTDIVNHRLKIAIEIQSSFHDTDKRKVIDAYKKNFWIERGYNFYNPDIRDYSILEIVNIFFPQLDVIPDYVDYNFSNCIDFVRIQEMLDSGHTIHEISDLLEINENTVRGIVRDKKLQLPSDYKERVFDIKPIIQLSKKGEYISRYSSLCDIERSGYSTGTIRRVLSKTQDFAYDCYWLYEKEYMSGEYCIPTAKDDKFLTAVDKYDMGNNYICSYKSIYEAEQDSISTRNEIYRVASGDRKSSRNEKWKFSMVA